MTDTNPNLLRQYLDTNSRLMPLRNWRSRTKDGMKAGKLPVDKKWQKSDYDNAEMFNHMKDGDNVGFKVGQGWGVLDFDPRNDLDNQGNVREQKSWTIWRVLADFGLKPGDYAVVETGGGGLHIYLRIPEGYHGREKLPDTYGQGVEFKTSERRYVVCAGSVHPGAQTEGLVGRQYVWGPGSLPLAKTCDAPATLLEAFKHKGPAEHMRGSGDETFGRFSGEQLEEVLSKLPVDKFGAAGDEDWFNFMCACHWFSGGEGREEFVEWSTSDPAYIDQAEIIRARWDSLSGETSGIKSGLVFKTLEKYGVSKNDMPREKTSEVFELPDAEDVTPTESSEENKVLKQMNRDHAMVILGSDVLVADKYYDYESQQITNRFIPVKNMRMFYANKKILVPKEGSPDKLEWTTKFDYWFEHSNRREYHGIQFIPEEGQEFYTPTGLYMNQWLGWPFDIADGRGIGDWDKLRNLMLQAICQNKQDRYEYLMNWMAYSLQNCRGPQGVAFVMRGPKGIGKSMLAEAWVKLFGFHGMITDNQDDVFGRFNWRVGTTCGLFLDEALWAGDQKMKGAVKTRITQKTIRVEQKYMPEQHVLNNLKIMMATNEQWAVPATEGERRFVVYDCKRVWPKGSKQYGEVMSQLYGTKTAPHTDGLRAMYYDLMHRDISNFHPERDAIATEGLGDQVRSGFGDFGQWWLEILQRGEMPLGFDPEASFRRDGPLSDWPNRPIAVPMQTLRDNLDGYLGKGARGDLAYNFKQKYIHILKKLVPEPLVKDKRITLPDAVPYMGVEKNTRGAANCFIFPPLSECRAYLSDLFAVEFDDDAPGSEIIDGTTGEVLDVDDLV